MLSKIYSFSGTNIILAAALIVGLLGLNILLLFQNRELKLTSSNRDREIVLKEGKYLIPLTGIDFYDQKQGFEWGTDNRKTIVMIFSPQCGYCHENMPIWNEIVNKADSSVFRIVAAASFSIGAKEFVNQYQFTKIPILVETDPTCRVDYVMYLTPQTILVSQNGEVEKVWIGPIQNEKIAEVEKSLNIRLSNEVARSNSQNSH